MPLIPFAASPNSTALSTSVCGAWSVATASAVPSTSAARQAAASSGPRNGGLTRKDDAYGSGDDRLVRPRVAARVPRPAPGAGDPLVGQREVVRRHVAGDRQAGRLGSTDELQGPCGRDVGQVQTGARHVPKDVGQDGQVARDGHLLGRGRPAAQTEDGRDETVVRLGAVGQGRLLGMVDDRQSERARVGERRPQDRGGPHRRSVIREPDHARVGQLAERRQSLPCPPDRHRPVREQLDRRAGGDGGRPDLRQDAGLVEGRCRVRHRADGREPAMGRRGQPARHRLRVLVAGLAQVGVQVDEPGRDDDPVGVDPLRRRRRTAR